MPSAIARWGSAIRTARATMAVVVAGLLALVVGIVAVAALTVEPTGPLERIAISDTLNCSVQHADDSTWSFYQDTACGTFLAVGGEVYGPSDIQSGPAPTAFTFVSESSTGSGAPDDPYRIETVVTAGDITITQVVSYTSGEDRYRTDITTVNNGSATTGELRVAADCYLQDDDEGFGLTDGTGAVSCVSARELSPDVWVPGLRLESFIPISPGSRFYYSDYQAVWAAVLTQDPLPDTCDGCDQRQDNGMALGWSLELAEGASVTRSLYTQIAPRGRQVASVAKIADASTATDFTTGYTITVSNPTDTAITLDSISDYLPLGFTYAPGSTTGATTGDPVVAGPAIVWDGPFELSAEGTVSLHFLATIDALPGTYYNYAAASSAAGEVVPSGATAPVTIGAGTLTLKKEVIGGPAETTAWTLTATGPSAGVSGPTGDPAVTNVTVYAGDYDLSESVGPALYRRLGWSCTGGTLTGITVSVTDGSNVTCTSTSESAPITTGDRYLFASVANEVRQYAADGTLVGTLVGSLGYNSGLDFDALRRLWVTNYDAGVVDRFETTGSFVAGLEGGLVNPESLVIDATRILVGDANPEESGTTAIVRQYSTSGDFVRSFSVSTEYHGADWIDLQGCTLYYTSEGATILRYDVCTDEQLSPFTTLPPWAAPGSTLREVKVRSNGEVFAAGISAIFRFDREGRLVQTYSLSDATTLRTLTLDPDGTSFWAGDTGSGSIYRVDMSSGVTMSRFETGTVLTGLRVTNENRLTGGTHITLRALIDGVPTADVNGVRMIAAGPTPISGFTGQPAVSYRGVTPGTYTLSTSTPSGLTAGDWDCLGASFDDGLLEVTADSSVLCTIGVTVGPAPLADGYIYLALTSGVVKQYDSTGTFVGQIVGQAEGRHTGMAFDSAGRLYVTRFDAGSIERFATSGAFEDVFAAGFIHPESLAFDGAGHVYVGQAGAPEIRKVNPDGSDAEAYAVATPDDAELHRTDWIDLSPDDCTLVYTSEAPPVQRYDACRRQQLPDLSAATYPAYALRVRPNGEVIVAATTAILRFAKDGTRLTSYTRPAWDYGGYLRDVDLDPDGTSFWAANGGSGWVYRFDISSGSLLSSFQATAGVYGLRIRSLPGLIGDPLTVELSGGIGYVSVTSGDGLISCESTSCTRAYIPDTSVTLTARADSTTYSFSGWTGCDSTSGTGGSVCTVTVAGATTVRATFARVVHRLTIELSGGTGSGSVTSGDGLVSCVASCTQDYSSHTSVTLTATATGPNHEFAGWTGCDATSGTNGSVCTVVMESAKSVRASFTAIDRQLTVELSGGIGYASVTSGDGSVDCRVSSCTYQLGSGSTTLTATADGSTYTFAGWTGCDTTSGTGGSVCTVALATDRTVTATFARVYHRLTVELSGGAGYVSASTGDGAIDCPGDCVEDYSSHTLVTLTATADVTTYSFAGWTGCDATSGTGGSVCTVTMESARTVTATFARVVHRLTVGLFDGIGYASVTSGDGAIDCRVASCTRDYSSHTLVTLTATADVTTFTFAGWTGCDATSGAGGSVCTVAMESATTVTATFARVYHTLTVELSGGIGYASVTSGEGSIDCRVARCTQDYIAHLLVTLTATADSTTYTFTGWTGCDATGGAGGSVCTVTMESARTVTATFTRVFHRLTVELSGGAGYVSASTGDGAIDCPGDCVEDYSSHTLVTLTATADVTTYSFAGWTGCDSTSGVGGSVCTVTMESARTVTATFARVVHRLTVELSGGVGFASVTSGDGLIDCTASSCTQDYSSHTVVTLHATDAPPALAFAGWTGCDSTGGTNGADCTVAMESAKTVRASFVAVTKSLTVEQSGGSGRVLSSPGGIDCTTASCSETVLAGATLTLTATPDAGYRFDRWTGCTPTTGTSCTLTVLDDTTATAHYVATFPLTVELSGGIGYASVTSGDGRIACTSSSCAATYDTGTLVTLTAVADVTTYSFAGWTGCDSTSGAGGSVCAVTVDASTSVVATFARVFHRLTVELSGGIGSASVTSGDGTIDCRVPSCSTDISSHTLVSLTATADITTWTFTGWTGCDATSGTGGSVCTVAMESARTVTATFARVYHRLTVELSGGAGYVSASTGDGAIDCPGDCVEDLSSHTVVTVTAVADATTYSFTGWTGCDSTSGVGGSVCTVTMESARTVTATFARVFHRLTVELSGGVGFASVTSGDGAIDCRVASCTRDYSSHTLVRLTATADVTTFTFAGWTGCDATSGTGGSVCTVAMESAKTVTATFARVYHTLTVELSGGIGLGSVAADDGGIGCGTDCVEDYSSHTVVTLTATTDGTGVSFIGWNGCDDPDGNVCSVTLEAARTVRATFQQFTADPSTWTTIFALALPAAGRGQAAGSPFLGTPTLEFTAATSTGYTITIEPATNPAASNSPRFRDPNIFALSLTPGDEVYPNRYVICVDGNRPDRLWHWEGTAWADITNSQTETPPGYADGRICGDTTSLSPFAVAVGSWDLTVLTAGGGTGTVAPSIAGDPCEPTAATCRSYSDGTVVVLTAAPTGGSTFGGWSGACSGTATTCTVTMDRARTVTATFSSAPPPPPPPPPAPAPPATEAITRQPVDRVGLPGLPVTFSLSTGDPGSTVAWERSATGTTWTRIAGATGRTLTVTPVATDQGARFRAVVTDPTGTATTSSVATLTLATLTKANVASGKAGATVILVGRGLSAATKVTFGGVKAPRIVAANATSIWVSIPAGAKTGKVVISIAGGTLQLAKFTITAGKAAPVISSLTPVSGPTGTIVTISGTNLIGTMSLRVGTVNVSYKVLSPAKVTFTVPAGVSTGKVTLVTAGGTVTSAATFRRTL